MCSGKKVTMAAGLKGSNWSVSFPEKPKGKLHVCIAEYFYGF